MKRILYSQHEDPSNNDYFVIDGEIDLNNQSNKSVEAFKIVNDVNNWKPLKDDKFITILKNGSSFAIKSHYDNYDAAGRKLFFVFYCESEKFESVIDFLKKDSLLIKRNFKYDNLEIDLHHSEKIKKVIVIIVVLVLILIVWILIK